MVLVITKEEREQWYCTHEVEILIGRYLDGMEGIFCLRCYTSTDKLVKALRNYLKEVQEGITAPRKKITCPFLIERNNGNNHFVSIIVEPHHKSSPPPGQAEEKPVITYQDSLGNPIPRRLKAVFRKLFPNAVINDLKLTQQYNNIDCGPLTVSNIVDMAKASRPLDKEALHIRTPKDMSIERILDMALLKTIGFHKYQDEEFEDSNDMKIRHATQKRMAQTHTAKKSRIPTLTF